MLTALPLLAEAGLAAATPSPPPPPPLPVTSEARRAIEVQLASPPRAGPEQQLSPEEVEAIAAAYLRSIGRRPVAEAAAGGPAPRTNGRQVRDWLP